MELKPKILIIEDEKSIANFICAILNANGYSSLIASTGKAGMSMISSHCPDLVILDLGLPDLDGMDLLVSMRKWTQLPVLVVSARTHERDKVEALDAGADDYITKPFGSSELLARIRTALRHTLSASGTAASSNGVFKVGELAIDYSKRQVTVRGETVHLTQNEYKIISILSRNAGKVMTYDSILRELWGPGSLSNNQVLRVHMANIRRKIEDNPAEPRYILTEVGVGYRMLDEV